LSTYLDLSSEPKRAQYINHIFASRILCIKADLLRQLDGQHPRDDSGDRHAFRATESTNDDDDLSDSRDQRCFVSLNGIPYSSINCLNNLRLSLHDPARDRQPPARRRLKSPGLRRTHRYRSDSWRITGTTASSSLRHRSASFSIPRPPSLSIVIGLLSKRKTQSIINFEHVPVTETSIKDEQPLPVVQIVFQEPSIG
jgi:hypothetical protein